MFESRNWNLRFHVLAVVSSMYAMVHNTTSLNMVCTLMMRGGGGPGKINSDSEVGGD